MSDPSPSDAPDWRPDPVRGLVVTVAQALMIGAAIYVFLRGWRRDIRVPLTFSSDSLFYLAQSKSTVDNGWWWFNPRLGAPLGLDELAFPSNSNVDQLLVWAISRFGPGAIATVNLAWGLMVTLSGVFATWGLRRLGASRISALVAGTLFALSPYAVYRNVSHFGLAIYLVPFPCVVALCLASARLPRGRLWNWGGVLTAGCALLGFDYVYYAFFGCFLIAVGSIVGFFTAWDRRLLRAGSFYVVVIAACTALNLAPSLYSWHQRGKPVVVHEKVPGEAEIYGLKIRQLVSPIFQHSFPPFRWWTEKEAKASFPVETENMVSRLGFVGTLGFLGLLSLLFVRTGPSPRVALLLAASRLALASVLLATIGGFGSLFSLLVSSDIRAYNRIAAFITFFSLAAVALAIDALFSAKRRRGAYVAFAVLLVGLLDQGQAFYPLNVGYPAVAAEVGALETFMRQLESRVPPNTMVLQLPLRVYLNDDGVGRMGTYDHFKPYLASRTLRFSYPALSNAQFRWQTAAGGMTPQTLARHAAGEGFAAILIDRFGYDDGGALVTAAIRSVAGQRSILAENDRYRALDIRALAAAPAAVPTPVACPGPVIAAIDLVGMMTAPAPGVSFHVNGAGEFSVAGWAVDQAAGALASGVEIVIGDATFPAFYGVDRRDVADYFKQPAYRQSGFLAAVSPAGLSKGTHPLALRVISSDGACYFQTPSVSIILD
jgi:phosphoglycerol transferase